MNVFSNVDTEYIRSSRTIETVIVSNSKTKKLFYVYNYEGYSFRVFRNVLSLIEFFEIGTDNFVHFETADELDNFLSNVELSQ